jgi:hypothetical protein
VRCQVGQPCGHEEGLQVALARPGVRGGPFGSVLPSGGVVGVDVEVEFVEGRVAAVDREVDGAVAGVLDHECVAVQFGQPRGEHRPQERPQRAAQWFVAAGQRVVELARHPFAAEDLAAGDAVGVEHEGGRAARHEGGDPAQRVRFGERAPQLGVDDGVDRLRFVACNFADGRWRSRSVRPAP